MKMVPYHKIIANGELRETPEIAYIAEKLTAHRFKHRQECVCGKKKLNCL